MTDIDIDLNSGPPLSDPLLDSLYRRMRTMHSLYSRAVDEMVAQRIGEIKLARDLVDLGGTTS